MRYIVMKSWGRRRPNKGDTDRPIVWCVREDTPAKTLVAIFATESEANRYAAVENFDGAEDK